MDYKNILRERRQLLKAPDFEAMPEEEWVEPDQRKGIAPPPLEKPPEGNEALVDLVPRDAFTAGAVTLAEAIGRRESRRVYREAPLSLEDLSFLLWATQGVREVDKNKVRTKRSTPSGGGRHPFETYLLVRRVNGITPGIYRYLPIEHKLVRISSSLPQPEDLLQKAWYQGFIGKAPVVFCWTATPYRTEWRYGIVSYKDILIEAGHICQNLYLACEAIGAGTCAIAAYGQRAMDELLGVDGTDEITVYIAPVGKV